MNYKTQISYIENSTIIKNITKSSFNFLIFNILNETKFKFFVYICENNFELDLAKKEIEFYTKEIKILKFPEWNTIPYDVNSPDTDIQITKMQTIFDLINLDKNKRTLLLISKNSLVQKIINKKDYKFLDISIDDKYSIQDIENLLLENCYNKKETSYNVGDFSINNNTIDLIAFNNLAYRLIIENNTIKEIKNLDTTSQIATGRNENIFTLPLSEVIFSQNNIQNFRQQYKILFGLPPENDYLYNSISENKFYNGCENWLPLFYKNNLETIFDYIPEKSVIIYDFNIIQKIKEFLDLIKNYYELRKNSKNINNIYNPIEIDSLYSNNFEEKIKNYINIVFDTENKVKNERQIELNFKNVPEFYKNSKHIFDEFREFLK